MLKNVNWKVFCRTLFYIVLALGFFYLSTKFTIKIMTFNLDPIKEASEYNDLKWMAILLELSKVIFTAGALLDKKINIVIRVCMVIISITLLGASIIANIGHIQNKANKVANDLIKTSVEYKDLEDGQARQKDLYGVKKSEITNTEASYNSRIEEMKKIKNSYGKNYITKKENMQKEINAIEAEKTNVIARLNGELTNINSSIAPIDTNNISVESTSGYIAVFQWISKTRLSQFLFKGASAEQLQGYFFVIIGSAFEFINMILFYLLSVYLKSNKILYGQKMPTPDPSPKQKIPEPKQESKQESPKLNLVKSKQALSLRAFKDSKLKDNDKLSDEDIKKYLEYVNQYCKDNNTNIVEGFQKISRQIGMKENRVREIVAWLKQEGILELKNGRFVIVKKEKVG